MIKFIVDLQEDDNHLKDVKSAMKELASLAVLIGIPEEKSSRDGEINNAELLYIHTNGAKRNKPAEDLYIHSKGSPINGIPPRPVIEPAIKDGKEVIGQLLSQASKKALDGDKQGMKQALENAGMQGQNMARGWFTNPKNGWAPLQKAAINNRENKMSKKKLEEMKIRQQEDEGFIAHRPLIDTGEMRKSITYVVKEK